MSPTIYNLDDWLWDTIPNKLPLVLKPIRTVSNIHLSFVIIELFDSECFSHWVS